MSKPTRPQKSANRPPAKTNARPLRKPAPGDGGIGDGHISRQREKNWHERDNPDRDTRPRLWWEDYRDGVKKVDASPALDAAIDRAVAQVATKKRRAKRT